MRTNRMQFTEKAASNHPLINCLIQDNPDVLFLASPDKPWDYSISNRNDKTIRIGLNKSQLNVRNYVITVALHELGHIRTNRKTIIGAEKAAWNWAKKYAAKHGYKINSLIEKDCLRRYYKSYLIARIVVIQSGKKNVKQMVEHMIRLEVNEAYKIKKRI